MRQFLLLLAACEGTERTTETVTVAESVERHEVVVTPEAPGDLCPGETPYQLLVCHVDFDGLGSVACQDQDALGEPVALLDGCLCWSQSDGSWTCPATPPAGWEYRLSWWQAVEAE